ncbi:MAG: hypothetical protein LRZ85_03935 [Alphaproteobacteria bacterium]|nr:hypothetical protein [Alphaproteobacteria bacterium]MCD8571651.1 hypothetical protein [Alphaproteobacteria bacterium]
MIKSITRLTGAFILLLCFWPAQVFACCVCIDEVGPASESEWTDPWPTGSQEVVNTHIDNEFNAHETWLLKFLLEDNILPAMMLMTKELTAVAMQQVGIIGSFFDAKQQMETQRVIKNLQADFHRDYHPSIGLCEFGSAAKSLAATERLADYNSVLIAQRSLDRQLGNAYTSAYGGEQYDKENRLNQFRSTYCDVKDNGGGMADICGPKALTDSSLPQQTSKEYLNRDIDYVNTVSLPWTLNVNYGNIETVPDEEAVFALENNLFGHKVFTRIPTAYLTGDRTITDPTGAAAVRGPEDVQAAYMDMRAVVAKRGVAENSYNALVGMKAEGTGASTVYLQEMMKELGIEKTEDLNALLGKNPSYYAQMEVLTKKIYQNPDFYTNLYDTPANVSRKEAAIQALELIQKFDMFKSTLRTEANLSLMLENAVMDLQTRAEDEFPEVPLGDGDGDVKTLDNLGGNSATP